MSGYSLTDTFLDADESFALREDRTQPYAWVAHTQGPRYTDIPGAGRRVDSEIKTSLCWITASIGK